MEWMTIDCEGVHSHLELLQAKLEVDMPDREGRGIEEGGGEEGGSRSFGRETAFATTTKIKEEV